MTTPLNISTITGLRCAEDLRVAEGLLADGVRIAKVILHHDATLCRRNIERTVAEAARLGVVLELLANENCLDHCPYRDRHYALYGRLTEAGGAGATSTRLIDPFSLACVARRLTAPHTLLELAGLVRPEDLARYGSLGIAHFKCGGRARSDPWIDRIASAYVGGRYSGNLFDLMMYTVPFVDLFGMTTSEIFFLRSDSETLAGHLAELFEEEDLFRRTCLRQDTAARMFAAGELAINDPGSSYVLRRGQVVLERPGRYLLHVRGLLSRAGESAAGAARGSRDRARPAGLPARRCGDTP
ncbi:MAG: hypothetical protein HY744_19215 [Deltaproteobacteria bacterium]|nr:hypothetical protein [Deltaproteobacteria bacterium]